MGVIKFNINSKIFYEDNEYIIKSYPSVDKVLLKQNISPYKEIIVKVNDSTFAHKTKLFFSVNS